MRRLLRVFLAVALAGALVGSVAVPALADEGEAVVDDGAEIGWGALAKLHAIASTKGVTVEELLDAVPFVNGDYEFGFGALKKDMTGEERDALKAQSKAYKEMLKSSMSLDDAEGEDTEGDPLAKATLLADALGVDVDQVVDLRSAGMGWGNIFRLAQIAAATGSDTSDLLVDGRFSYGQVKKMLTDDQLASIKPKSFGQLNSAAKKGGGKDKAKDKDN